MRSYEIDGRTVTMPCEVRDASAGTALFEVDAAAAAAMVPAPFRVVETAPGHCHLVVAVIDYRDNDLGDYREVGLSLFVTPARPGRSSPTCRSTRPSPARPAGPSGASPRPSRRSTSTAPATAW